jgi:DNA polymerase III subunit epsilon
MSVFKTLGEVHARNNFVVLDTETTGLDSSAEIIEIAIIDASGATLINTRVKALNPIPPGASNVHGIYAKDLVDAPLWIEVREKCMALMNGKDVIIYNRDYDTKLLRYTDAHNGIKENAWKNIEFWCAMLAYAEHRGEWNSYRNSPKWHKLDAAMIQQKLKVDNAHAALGDCLMTLALMNKMYGEKV